MPVRIRGSQLVCRLMPTRLKKIAAHSRTVPRPRPSRNTSDTGALRTSASSWVKTVPGANLSPGKTFCRLLAICSLGAPRAIRKRLDSGKATQRSGSSRIGTRPPTRNSDAQPCCCTSPEATRPPIAGPMAKPQTVIVTIVFFVRIGPYSATRAMATGMAPPRPRPVRKRRTSICCGVAAKLVATENRPKAAVDASRMVLRPMRSPSVPSTKAPIIRPNRPALITGPRAPRLICHFATRAGAT